MLHLVIMAGGSGTRFWPESRRARPKQFLALAGDRSLLQQAADRCRGWIPADRIHVVTNAAHASETRRQLPDLPPENLLLEPCGRNTAPCIGLAALCVVRKDADATLLVTPADHLIRPEAEFRATVERAAALSQRHPRASILFGISPTSPATGYGYIERERGQPDRETGAYGVHSFREKPTREAAQGFLGAGTYYWNAGIFLWRAAHLLQLLREFQPEIHARLMRLDQALGSARWDEALGREFPGMPSISIDYGVLEPIAERQGGDDGVYVVPASFAWDDVGSWPALPRVLESDELGNTVSGLFRGLDTRDCVIRTSDKHLVATIGVSNLVIVHTPDATLIAPKNDEASLRRLVALLEERGDEQFL